MVKHDILVRGVDMGGNEQKAPVLLQMHDDDFPARFLHDLASPEQTPISTTTVLNIPSPMLYQPVQRILNVALVDLRCDSLTYPRVDPTRIVSAGLVIRRVYRQKGINGGAPWDDYNTLSAWMRCPKGKFGWVQLNAKDENCDPDPTKRPQLSSGQAELDRQLAAQTLSSAYTEGTTPAFAAPPATNAALCRTVVYALIPTASSEVSDTPPLQPPLIDRKSLVKSLPRLLKSSEHRKKRPSTPQPPPTVDYRWMSDEFLNTMYPPISSGSSSSDSGSSGSSTSGSSGSSSTAGPPTPPTPNPDFTSFQHFTTALRMLNSVFNALTPTTTNEINPILQILNKHNVTMPDGTTQPMGDFYQSAQTILLPLPQTSTYPVVSGTPPTLQMPTDWDPLDDQDEKDLVDAMVKALQSSTSLQMLSPQGRFQDSSRFYKLRMFFRIKPESGTCPPQLVWSHYSEPFQIAPWHTSGPRTPPPIPLPDPISSFLQNATPNCSFLVPGSLMNAMQGTTMSGLMSGAGGGASSSLSWLCGFNIPLITICAFFVLNIFLSLLNIVFFWLPIIKICIPFPSPSPSNPDGGSP